jgi:hypothetical protein
MPAAIIEILRIDRGRVNRFDRREMRLPVGYRMERSSRRLMAAPLLLPPHQERPPGHRRSAGRVGKSMAEFERGAAGVSVQ